MGTDRRTGGVDGRTGRTERMGGWSGKGGADVADREGKTEGAGRAGKDKRSWQRGKDKWSGQRAGENRESNSRCRKTEKIDKQYLDEVPQQSARFLCDCVSMWLRISKAAHEPQSSKDIKRQGPDLNILLSSPEGHPPRMRKNKTMTMTKIPSQKTCYTYCHGHLKVCSQGGEE